MRHVAASAPVLGFPTVGSCEHLANRAARDSSRSDGRNCVLLRLLFRVELCSSNGNDVGVFDHAGGISKNAASPSVGFTSLESMYRQRAFEAALKTTQTTETISREVQRSLTSS
jgi:hypothetical protein